MKKEMECALIGKWRILEANLWHRDDLDLVTPAHFTFAGNGHGDFAFGCVTGGLEIETCFHLGDEAILQAQKW